MCTQRNPSMLLEKRFDCKRWHCVLRTWKSFKVDLSGQTYVFKTKIAQGIQKWVQNNQLSSQPSTDFFKKLFFGKKKMSK